MSIKIFLTRRMLTVSVLLLAASPLLATELVRPKPLIDFADLELAQTLYTAHQHWNTGLDACLVGGKHSLSECQCRYSKEATQTKGSYEKVLEARPKWKGKILYWKHPDSLQSQTLIMPAIEHQLNSLSAACAFSP